MTYVMSCEVYQVVAQTSFINSESWLILIDHLLDKGSLRERTNQWQLSLPNIYLKQNHGFSHDMDVGENQQECNADFLKHFFDVLLKIGFVNK